MLKLKYLSYLKMKTFIVSYFENLEFALTTKFIMKKDWNIESWLILGNKIDNDKYTRTNVLHWNWIEHILPELIKCNDDVIVMEDDVRLTKELDELPFDDYDICWFGFRRGRLEQKKQRITGTQGIYFKKEVLQDLNEHFNNYKKKIHADNCMSQFCIKYKDKYKVYQPLLSYVYEKDHESHISLDNWAMYTKPKKNIENIKNDKD